MQTFDTIVNISDTVGQYTTALNAPSPAPDAELTVVTDPELRRRQIFRVVVFLIVLAGIGFLIFKSKK